MIPVARRPEQRPLVPMPRPAQGQATSQATSSQQPSAAMAASSQPSSREASRPVGLTAAQHELANSANQGQVIYPKREQVTSPENFAQVHPKYQERYVLQEGDRYAVVGPPWHGDLSPITPKGV